MIIEIIAIRRNTTPALFALHRHGDRAAGLIIVAIRLCSPIDCSGITIIGSCFCTVGAIGIAVEAEFQFASLAAHARDAARGAEVLGSAIVYQTTNSRRGRNCPIGLLNLLGSLHDLGDAVDVAVTGDLDPDVVGAGVGCAVT